MYYYYTAVQQAENSWNWIFFWTAVHTVLCYTSDGFFWVHSLQQDQPQKKRPELKECADLKKTSIENRQHYTSSKTCFQIHRLRVSFIGVGLSYLVPSNDNFNCQLKVSAWREITDTYFSSFKWIDIFRRVFSNGFFGIFLISMENYTFWVENFYIKVIVKAPKKVWKM